jgi:hypothetical protein
MAMKLSSVAVGEIFEVNPAAVKFRISPIRDLHGVVEGDWDLARRYVFAETVKYRAIRERFIEGKSWEDTDLFRDLYQRRLKSGHVRGETSIKGLAAQYYDRVDALFNSLKTEGFKTHREDGEPLPLPGLYLGRDGEVFIGNQGNHRLAIAQVLCMEKMLGKLICKHPSFA